MADEKVADSKKADDKKTEHTSEESKETKDEPKTGSNEGGATKKSKKNKRSRKKPQNKNTSESDATPEGDAQKGGVANGDMIDKENLECEPVDGNGEEDKREKEGEEVGEMKRFSSEKRGSSGRRQSDFYLDDQLAEKVDKDVRDLLEDKDRPLASQDRARLYAYGEECESKDDLLNVALLTYLRCIRGLTDTETFKPLPKCLRKIAALYYKREEYEKAVQFIQAEKLYYESALVDIRGLRLGFNKAMDSDMSEDDPHADDPEAKRAVEYENLARLCLKKQQPSLALEYQAKATKLRQKVYGEQHPVTTDSLDFFTMIYAEVGKEQYSESMQKMHSAPIVDEAANSSNTAATNSDTAAANSNKSGADKTTELRRRRKKNAQHQKQDAEAERLAEQAREEELDKQEQDLWVSQMIVLLLLVVALVVLSLLGLYTYCRMTPRSYTCMTVKGDLHYYYMRFKYFIFKIYAMFTRADNTYG